MKHNKYGFKIGDEVILDANFRNWSKVTIDGMTPNEMFSTVHSSEDPDKSQWQTMTNRLTPIKY